MHDPRHTIPLVGAIVGALAVAGATVYIFVTGGYRYQDVPRPYAALTKTQRDLVKLAKDYGPGSGILYVWGGSSSHGFDCSGYTSFVARLAGINSVPRTSFSQFNDSHAIKVPKTNLRPGDFVYFKSYGSYTSPGHVGLYIGNGEMIEYYRTGYPAKRGLLSAHNDYAGARRWWHPAAVRKRIYGTAIFVAMHWHIRISGSTGWTVVFVPAVGHKTFNARNRAAIVKWAHNHHHHTSGNRSYLDIKLR